MSYLLRHLLGPSFELALPSSDSLRLASAAGTSPHDPLSNTLSHSSHHQRNPNPAPITPSKSALTSHTLPPTLSARLACVTVLANSHFFTCSPSTIPTPPIPSVLTSRYARGLRPQGGGPRSLERWVRARFWRAARRRWLGCGRGVRRAREPERVVRRIWWRG